MPLSDSSRILVTGGTGFIGGNLVRTLLGEGRTVRALVRDPARAADIEGAELFRGDLLDPESLVGIERDVDVVVHCAGILGKWGTPRSRLRAVNVQGTLALLERFRDSGLHRFVHLSAGGVSGPLRREAVDETYRCRPATPYEKTKLMAERKVLENSGPWNIPAVVLRPTFTYGPGDPHKVALFRAVRRGRYGYIGGGWSVNHPVYIDDLIRGILLAIERGRPGEVYIIGGERPTTKRQLVSAIADALNVKKPKLSVPRWIATLAAWKLELLGRVLRFEPILTRSRVMMMADNFGYSIEKARRELEYEPKTSLRRGIDMTVGSYMESGLL